MFTTFLFVYTVVFLSILGLGHHFLLRVSKYTRTLFNLKQKVRKPKARLFSFLPRNKKPESPLYVRFIKYGYYTTIISALLLFINYEPVSLQVLNNIKTIDDLAKADPFASASAFLMIPMVVSVVVSMTCVILVLVKFMEHAIAISLYKIVRFLFNKIKQLVKFIWNLIFKKPNNSQTQSITS